MMPPFALPGVPEPGEAVRLPVNPESTADPSERWYRIDRVLGEGAFSTVVGARYHDHRPPGGEQHVAIKWNHRAKASRFAKLQREAFILRQLRHKNVVQLREACADAGGANAATTKRALVLVLEYVPGGNLAEFMQAHWQ